MPKIAILPMEENMTLRGQQTQQRPRFSWLDVCFVILSAFLLGSLLTGVSMSLMVANYLSSVPQPTTMSNFNFIDDLAMYELIAFGGLILLVMLGLVSRLVQYMRRRPLPIDSR